jgi:glutathione S-transferase
LRAVRSLIFRRSNRAAKSDGQGCKAAPPQPEWNLARGKAKELGDPQRLGGCVDLCPGPYAGVVATAEQGRPVLWHLAMSHYNEKVRWAFDYKRVPHVRRAVMPPAHALVAMRLGGRDTFPVLTVGDRVFPDSTEIIAALEEIAPDPPLYPEDPAGRARALELEERFDLGIGRTVRQVGYQRILDDPQTAVEMLSLGGPLARRRAVALIFPALARGMRKRFRVPGPGEGGPLAELEAEIAFIGDQVGDSGFLVGERFSVADLTAAALLAPVVCAEAMPAGLPPFPLSLQELSARLGETPGGSWARSIYLEYR